MSINIECAKVSFHGSDLEQLTSDLSELLIACGTNEDEAEVLQAYKKHLLTLEKNSFSPILARKVINNLFGIANFTPNEVSRFPVLKLANTVIESESVAPRDWKMLVRDVCQLTWEKTYYTLLL